MIATSARGPGCRVGLVAAVRVTGTFDSVHTRTVEQQHHPYPGLAAAAAAAPTQTWSDIDGSLVGFRTPDFEDVISVAGYHQHFINAARNHGGHVFDATLRHGSVAISIASEVHLSLPQSGAFLRTNLVSPNERDAIHHAEG